MPASIDDELTQHLITARRNQILDGAARVLAEKGFHRATIRDIAQAAGVADGTIYNYFENKTALLLGLLNRLNETEQREEHFARSAEMEIADFVHMYLNQRLKTITDAGLDLFHALLSEILVNPELRALYYGQVVEPTFGIAEQYARQWTEQGVSQRVDPPLMLRALAGMTLGVLLLRLMGDKQLHDHWDAVPDLLAELILHGIVPANGEHNATNDSPNPTARPASTGEPEV
jgi:AcrR family transcriptional regulator